MIKAQQNVFFAKEALCRQACRKLLRQHSHQLDATGFGVPTLNAMPKPSASDLLKQLALANLLT